MTSSTPQEKKDVFTLDYGTGTLLGPLSKAQKEELVAARNEEHGSKLAVGDVEFAVVKDRIGRSADVRVTEKEKPAEPEKPKGK